VDCIGNWVLGTTCSTNECGQTGYFRDVYKITTAGTTKGKQCPIQNDAPKWDRPCTPDPRSCVVIVDYVFDADPNGPDIDRWIFRKNGTFSHFKIFYDKTPDVTGTWTKSGNQLILINSSTGSRWVTGIDNDMSQGFRGISFGGAGYMPQNGMDVFDSVSSQVSPKPCNLVTANDNNFCDCYPASSLC
jgi:hypothetical protein